MLFPVVIRIARHSTFGGIAHALPSVSCRRLCPIPIETGVSALVAPVALQIWLDVMKATAGVSGKGVDAITECGTVFVIRCSSRIRTTCVVVPPVRILSDWVDSVGDTSACQRASYCTRDCPNGCAYGTRHAPQCRAGGRPASHTASHAADYGTGGSPWLTA